MDANNNNHRQQSAGKMEQRRKVVLGIESLEESPRARARWDKYEQLLRDAVHDDHYQGLVQLLKEGKAMKEFDKFQPTCYIPLAEAIKNNNIPMIALFQENDYDCGLRQPLEDAGTEFSNRYGEENTFDKAKKQVVVVEALSNPVWISLDADDPFQVAFELCELNRRLRHCDDSYRKIYDDLYKATRQYGADLLDEISNHEEGRTLMRSKRDRERGDYRLDFITRAIRYDQQEVIAHPVTQHFLTSHVFDQVPVLQGPLSWKSGGVKSRMLIGTFIGLLYPITTILNIVIPSSCFSHTPSVGNNRNARKPSVIKELSTFADKPLVRFINGIFSFMTYLILLTVYCTQDYHGLRKGDDPTALEITIFVFVIGFIFSEVKQLWRRGVCSYINSGWNLVDVITYFLMLVSIGAWIGLYVENPLKTGQPLQNITLQRNTTLAPIAVVKIRYVADFSFAFAVVLSFFRILYICQITSYLGLIQLCIGEMIFVICQFAFICGVVLISFSVGMLYLSNATPQGRSKKIEHEIKNVNETAIYKAFGESFAGLFSTLKTMVYVSLTLQDTDTLEHFHDGTLIEVFTNLMFITYFGISMIIVMNMLIAMMNSSYQKIVDDLDLWHLNSRTKLWMEYISGEQARLVPFNLIPTVDKIMYVAKGIHQKYFTNESIREGTVNDNEIMKYNDLCRDLRSRYLRKVTGSSSYPDPPACNIDPKNDPFLLKIQACFNEWLDMDDTIPYGKSKCDEDPDYSRSGDSEVSYRNGMPECDSQSNLLVKGIRRKSAEEIELGNPV